MLNQLMRDVLDEQGPKALIIIVQAAVASYDQNLADDDVLLSQPQHKNTAYLDDVMKALDKLVG